MTRIIFKIGICRRVLRVTRNSEFPVEFFRDKGTGIIRSSGAAV